MQILMAARHCEIPDALRRRAAQLVGKVAKVAHRPQRAEVVFDNDHQAKVVELKMLLPRGRILLARAEAEDFRSALDKAVEKLRHQADKEATRVLRKTPSS